MSSPTSAATTADLSATREQARRYAAKWRASASFLLFCGKPPEDLVLRLQLEYGKAPIAVGPVDPILPVLLAGAAALVLHVVDLGEDGRRRRSRYS